MFCPARSVALLPVVLFLSVTTSGKEVANASDLNALNRELGEAGYNKVVYPPARGELLTTGWVYQRIGNFLGKLQPTRLCEYAFTVQPYKGDYIFKSTSYDTNVSGGTNIELMPGVLKGVNVKAELKGTRIRNINFSVDGAKFDELPAGEKRILRKGCDAFLFKADGKKKVRHNIHLITKALYADSLTYSFKFQDESKVDIQAVANKVATANPNFTVTRKGATDLSIKPNQGSFLLAYFQVIANNRRNFDISDVEK